MTVGAILEARDIRVRREGRELLQIEAFVCPPGETTALLGPNGAGKSTFVRVLAGLEEPAEGEVRFMGEAFPRGRALSAVRRRMAVAFQTPLLFDATVFSNVAAGLRFRGVDKSRMRPRVEKALGALGIAHLAGRSARTLSGGEASRVSLARALVLEPEVLLLDEPFGSLDAPTREGVSHDLAGWIWETRTTTVFVTHDTAEAVRLARRMMILWGGRIVQAGPCEEVLRTPHDESVARFLGIETILRGRVASIEGESYCVEVDGGRIVAAGEAAVGEEVLLCLRSEDVMISGRPLDRGGISARNAFAGRVREIVPLAHGCKVYLDCGFPLAAAVTRHSVEGLGLAPGREVQALFKATAVHAIRL
jgi:tungstate transport system ATP-binding protein